MKQGENGKESAGRKIAHVLGIILCIILIPILIVNVTMIVKSIVHADRVPDFLGYKPFIVLSNSMYPAIETGDLVIVKDVSNAATLQLNDVIAFRNKEGKVITHRIIGVDNNEVTSFVTKGDNNNVEDSNKVESTSLEGKYLVRIPKLGSFAMFLQEPIGLLIFVVTPIFIFIIWDIFSRNSKSKETSKKEEELQAEIDRLRKMAEEKTDKDQEVEENKDEKKEEIKEEVKTEEEDKKITVKEGDEGALEDKDVIDSEKEAESAEVTEETDIPKDEVVIEEKEKTEEETKKIQETAEEQDAEDKNETPEKQDAEEETKE